MVRYRGATFTSSEGDQRDKRLDEHIDVAQRIKLD